MPEADTYAPLPHSAGAYIQAAQDFVNAYEQDPSALDRLNQHYERSFTIDDVRAEIWRRVYAFRQRSSKVSKNFLKLEEAQIMIAQDAGFSSWAALVEAAENGSGAQAPPYIFDSHAKRVGPARRMTSAEWDNLIAVVREHRLTSIEGNGLLTDAVLERIAKLDHVTSINLGGSREISDKGLMYLSQMPQLEALDLSEYPGGRLTDQGLELLRSLPNLRKFQMTWQAGISDAGVANLRYCDQLEEVNLMGSPTGDGAIEALQGKPNLRNFSTGRLVTDDGLRLLHNFPRFKAWNGPPPDSATLDELKLASSLLIDGPFSDQGLSGIAGLNGVADLDLFWHVTGISTQAFAHLVDLPNLLSLGCDGALSDNVAMGHIGRMPRLRNLRAQESVATDDGFVALSRSRTLEGLWGRVCPNFGSAGFLALSRIPSLRKLGIGCQNVDDQALSSLPDFPGLEELTPIGFTDDGFRHIGRCPRLRRLTCMYCRDTTDVATDHIEPLQIIYYYAGLTKITDRSLATLGRMPSLEQIDFYECNGVTDAGLSYLSALPRLREVHLDSLPGVTYEGTKVFPDSVRVHYST